MRAISAKELAHENLGEEFVKKVCVYDAARRLEVLIDQFLVQRKVFPGANWRNLRVLDAGCGRGDFSRRLLEVGFRPVAIDIGPSIVERVAKVLNIEARVVDLLSLSSTLGRKSQDVVVSSEVVEHTPSPVDAVRQLCRVVDDGGYLSISTPNKKYQWLVRLASSLNLRPYHALENFLTWDELLSAIRNEGLEILEARGLHLFPFQTRLYPLLRFCDEHLQSCKDIMINMCVLAARSK